LSILPKPIKHLLNMPAMTVRVYRVDYRNAGYEQKQRADKE
jgi:hypothetical protein